MTRNLNAPSAWETEFTKVQSRLSEWGESAQLIALGRVGDKDGHWKPADAMAVVSETLLTVVVANLAAEYRVLIPSVSVDGNRTRIGFPSYEGITVFSPSSSDLSEIVGALVARGATEGGNIWADEAAATEGTKTCPECAEEIKTAAVVCHYCGYRFDRQSNATSSGLAAQSSIATSGVAARTSGLAVAAFVCSMLGLWFVGIPMAFSASRDIDGSNGEIGGAGYVYAALVFGSFGAIATFILLVYVTKDL